MLTLGSRRHLPWDPVQQRCMVMAGEGGGQGADPEAVGTALDGFGPRGCVGVTHDSTQCPSMDGSFRPTHTPTPPTLDRLTHPHPRLTVASSAALLAGDCVRVLATDRVRLSRELQSIPGCKKTEIWS